jgi:8-oxo-dGTP diphosphatase
MDQQKIIFGEKVIGKSYIARVGIYAIILSDDKEKLAIIKTKTGYFLPGGGLEADETHLQCLIREAKEEMGWKIEIGKYLGNSASFFFSTTKKDYYYNDCYFYFAEKVVQSSYPTESDHGVVWLTPARAIKKLWHKNQAWAVEKAFGKS